MKFTSIPFTLGARESEKLAARWETFRLRGSPHGFKKPGEKLVGLTIDTFGTIPGSESEKLAKINALAKKTLTVDQLYLHEVEAINNTLISDRWMFMASSSLKNMAADADIGIAVLNSHNQYELPIGRTFAGHYEQVLLGTGKVAERCLMAFYMPRGYFPNGSAQPGTDAINEGIEYGTTFDVSIGYYRGLEGKSICNVCDQPYIGGGCQHWRGSNEGMTLEQQIYARDVLGVPGGVCTVRLENYHVNEVSPVFDGAVSGAGFI